MLGIHFKMDFSCNFLYYSLFFAQKKFCSTLYLHQFFNHFTFLPSEHKHIEQKLHCVEECIIYSFKGEFSALGITRSNYIY